MSRPLALLILLVALLVVGLFVLAGGGAERPHARVEKAVDLANLS